MTSAISALVHPSTLYAGQTGCEKVLEGLESAQALKSQMYDEAEMLLETYKLEITNGRTVSNCNDTFLMRVKS